MDEPEEEPLIGSRAAAEILGVHINTVRHWADAGILPVAWRMPHGQFRYRPADVRRLAEKGRRS